MQNKKIVLMIFIFIGIILIMLIYSTKPPSTESTNLALEKTVIANSSYKGWTGEKFVTWDPSLVVDGKIDHPSPIDAWWSSGKNLPQWIQVDLGKDYIINQIKVDPDSAAYVAVATDYTIKYATSLDADNWKNFNPPIVESNATARVNIGGCDYEYNFQPVEARDIRITITESQSSDTRWSGYGVFDEIEVYNK